MDLKPGKLILFFGVFCFVISMVFIYVIFFVLEEYENGGLLSVLSIFTGFFSIGLYLTLHYYNYQITIGEKSMVIKNELGNKTEIHWNKIDKVDYNKTFNMIIVIYNKKRKWISPVYDHIINYIEPEKYTEKLTNMIK